MNRTVHNKLVLTLILNLILSTSLFAQLRVGDPGVEIDQSKFDADYPQMERWANTGVRGGIPFINSFTKTATVNPGNSTELNVAITSMSNSLSGNQKGLITLKNGSYAINASVKMKSNVSLIGESRDGVICTITMLGSDAFSFNNVKYAGIYNLTIQGGWGVPKYPWNYSLDANREFSNTNISVKLSNGSTDCWLDKVTILNSAKDPLRCPANHNTFRDLIVDGCFRKAGGAEGYFFIQGGDNLITGCQVTRLRHISLQGGNVEYNVVYDNDFLQEVSFHSGDNGNNLIENNRITLPSDMPPIEAGEKGPYPETENGKPTYFAIMGPWSTMHDVSSHPNFIYRNQILQLNHNYGPREPWSGESNVYFGPKAKGLSNQQRIDNFPVYSKGVPSGGTLYAVLLGDPIPATRIQISQKELTLKVHETTTLSATVLPDSATNKKVTWQSTNATICTISDKGLVTPKSEGTSKIIVTSNDGGFADTCIITITGILEIPVSSVQLSKNAASIQPGKELTLTYEIMPENAFNKTVTWSSSDTSIAEVTNGKILAKNIGAANITITTSDGNKTSVCSLTVSNEISFSENFSNLKLDGWGSETYTGSNDIVWTVDAKGVSDYISGKGVYFHAGNIGIKSGQIEGGIGSFSVKCLNKWSDGAARKIELLVNNKVVATKTHTGSALYTFSVENINVQGTFTLAIKNASTGTENYTIAFDDITWTSFSGNTRIEETKTIQHMVYPNPFKQHLTIKNNNAYNNLSLFDLSGRTLFSKDIDPNQNVILSPSYTQIPKGIYILQLQSKTEKNSIRLLRQ